MPVRQLQVPKFIAPQVPILSAEPPTGSGWVHEIKHDGFRTLLRIDGKDVRAFTRNGYDWSDKYQRIIEARGNLSCSSALIDGEVIVQNDKGVSDFAALRAAIEREPHRLVLYAFDLLFLNGKDWRREPLLERRSRLERLIDKDACGAIQFSDHYDGEGIDLFKGACEMGLEGIVSKRASASYRSGPTRFWLKTKNTVESELVLLGTDHDNEGKPIAYLGREDGSELQFAGTAFLTLAGKPRDELQKRIQKLLTTKPPVPLRTWRKPQWLKPELRVKVRHLAGGDTLRHASVQALVVRSG
jgi:bifunctional non-homologous end joining protein LigD